MGAPTISSSSQTSGQMGQAIADAGTEIGRGMSTSYQKEMERLNLANAKADLRSKQLRNADFVKQSMDASSLAKINNRIDSKKDEDFHKIITPEGELKVPKKYSTADAGSEIFGDAAEELIGGLNFKKAMQIKKFDQAWKANRNRQKSKRGYYKNKWQPTGFAVWDLIRKLID